MQAFHATGEQQLRWAPAGHAPRRYALRSGDSLLATLTWAGHARVVGDWLGKRVTFAFEGWVRPRVVAREEDVSPALTTEPLTTEPFATFTRRTGLLLFTDGQRFQWKRPARASCDHIWMDASGATVMRFSPDKRATDVLIGAGAPDAIALVLLALGECLLVATEDEAVAATTAAVVAVIASS